MDVNIHVLRDAVAARIGEAGIRILTYALIATVGIACAWVLVFQIDLAVIGLLVGCIYALGAVGLSLVYGNMHFPNVAHGDYMTAGAFVALAVMLSLVPESWNQNSVGPFTFPYTIFIALPIGMIAIAVLSIVIDRVVFRHMRIRGAHIGVMTLGSLGIAIALRGFIQYLWGTDIEQYPRVSKKFLTFQVEMLDTTIRVPPDMLFVAVVALLLTFAMYLFLKLTKWGKAMRAAADNEDLARVSGIDVERTNLLTWGISGAMAAAAGILLAAGQGQLLTISGWKLLIPMFAAVVAGGIGNPYGAFAGAIFIGLVGEVSTAWLEPTYKPAVFFAAIIVLLLVRPRGIFGESRI